MHALVLNKLHEGLDYQQVTLKKPARHESVIELQAAALNHRDVYITEGQYAGIKFPTILGSDGAGKLGGKEVVINPALFWGKNLHAPGPDFRILGLPEDGTFAEAVVVPKSNIFEKPAHLSMVEAAAFPLAGLTAFRALFTKIRLKKGEKILISGIGGGVALMALQLAVAAGAEVAEFDPLTEPLPPDSTGLILPGGFPEQHLETLSANAELREQVCRLAARAPVHAECGGLAYLMDELDGHPMCGVLGGTARFTPWLTLGYRDAVAIADSPLFTTGQRVVGHEFHRTAVEFSGDREPAWVFHGSDGATVRDGALRAGVHASYLHTHPAAQPQSIARFVRCAGQVTKLGG